MNTIKQNAILVLVLLMQHVALAQTNAINVVTTAVPFLRIPSDARYSGMGAAGIAAAPDLNAVFVNAGRLPYIKSKAGISANYSPWLREWTGDMYLASLAGYKQINENEVLHGVIKYFNPGSLQFTDNNGNKLQSYRPNEFYAQAGYSRKLSTRLGLGISVKYIRSDLAKGTMDGQSYSTGNAVAADLGLFYTLQNENGEGWAFGAAFTNLGSKISYTNNANDKAFIPANLGLGTSYTKSFDEKNKLSFALDLNKLLVPTPPSAGDSSKLVAYKSKTAVGSWFSSFGDAPGGLKEELKEFQLSVGAEYWYNEQFALRAGYFWEDKTKGDRSFFSTGVGVVYNVITFNFSYMIPSSNGVIRNPLSNTLQFGVTLHFNN